MWIRYCPMVNGKCEEGKPNSSELPCAHWDSLEGECVLVTQALLSVAFHRRQLAKMDMIDDLQAELLSDNGFSKGTNIAAVLEANLPKAEEFGKSKITKRPDSEAHKD